MKRDDELRRVAEWLLGDDTGVSSEAICARMMGAEPNSRRFGHPSDPSDFGRCYRLLKLIPEWRPRIKDMAACGPYWAALVKRWDEIEASYLNETSNGPRAQATYDLMRRILDPITDKDKSVIRLGPGVTMRFGE